MFLFFLKLRDYEDFFRGFGLLSLKMIFCIAQLKMLGQNCMA